MQCSSASSATSSSCRASSASASASCWARGWRRRTARRAVSVNPATARIRDRHRGLAGRDRSLHGALRVRHRPGVAFAFTVIVMVFASPVVNPNTFAILISGLAPFAWPLAEREAGSPGLDGRRGDELPSPGADEVRKPPVIAGDHRAAPGLTCAWRTGRPRAGATHNCAPGLRRTLRPWRRKRWQT